MYAKYCGGEVTVWCDGRGENPESDSRSKRKRGAESAGTSRRQKEEEVETIFKDLKDKHGNKYNTPKLRLSSRMILSQLHEDLENPLDIPAFTFNFKFHFLNVNTCYQTTPTACTCARLTLRMRMSSIIQFQN